MNSAMPALVNFAAAPHSVELREVAAPEIGPRDVLLQVRGERARQRLSPRHLFFTR